MLATKYLCVEFVDKLYKTIEDMETDAIITNILNVRYWKRDAKVKMAI